MTGRPLTRPPAALVAWALWWLTVAMRPAHVTLWLRETAR